MLFSLKLLVITGCKKYKWIKIELNRALVRKKQLWLSKPIIFKLMRLIMNLSDPLLCMVALPRRKRPYNTPTQKQKLRNSRLWKTPQSLVNRVTKFAKWTNYLSHSRRCNNFSILLEKQLFLWVPIHSNKHPSHLATTCIVVIRLSKYWQLNVQKRNQLTREQLTSSFLNHRVLEVAFYNNLMEVRDYSTAPSRLFQTLISLRAMGERTGKVIPNIIFQWMNT